MKWALSLLLVSNLSYGSEIYNRNIEQSEYKHNYYVKDCFLFNTTIPKNRLTKEHMVAMSSMSINGAVCDIYSHQSGRKQLECRCKDLELCVTEFGVYMPEGERDPFIETGVSIWIESDQNKSMIELKELKRMFINLVDQCKVNEQ